MIQILTVQMRLVTHFKMNLESFSKWDLFGESARASTRQPPASVEETREPVFQRPGRFHVAFGSVFWIRTFGWWD